MASVNIVSLGRILAVFLLMAPTSAYCAEAWGLKVLGFSPDGRYFGFIQYGGVGDGGEFVAEMQVIDVERDRLTPGMPRLVTSGDDDLPFDDPRPHEKWLQSYAEKQFAAMLDPYAFQRPSRPPAADEAARSGEAFGITSDDKLSLGLRKFWIDHRKLGRVTFDLEIKRITWPKTSRTSSHPQAIACSREVDWEPGAAFRLTLRHGKQSVVLNDDRTIPASRHCVLGYGISEVHSFDRRDGKVAIAVVLGMGVRGFEGNDRRFLVVTTALGR
jgi:predicted secreted protein